MVEIRKKKIKKNHGEKEGEEDQMDRLSDLPDTILIHILSFLPGTKHCVQTSVLSKRWKWLCVSLPDLIFHSYHCRYSSSFPKLVSHVLSMHDKNLSVNNLSFYYNRIDESFIGGVINYAASHNVNHLSLSLPSASLKLLFPLFNACRSLKTLRLESFENLNLLKNFTLSCLTTLYIFNCSFFFSDEFEPTPFDPFAGLVNLKSLHLQACRVGDVENFRIMGPQLDSFTIHGYFGCKFEILAPKLRFFTFRNISAEEFPNLDFPLLKFVDVDQFLTRQITEKSILDLINMFHGFYHAQSLIISSNLVEGLMKFPDVLENQASSPFVKLKTLKVICGFSRSLNIPNNVMNYFGKNITLEKI